MKKLLTRFKNKDSEKIFTKTSMIYLKNTGSNKRFIIIKKSKKENQKIIFIEIELKVISHK